MDIFREGRPFIIFFSVPPPLPGAWLMTFRGPLPNYYQINIYSAFVLQNVKQLFCIEILDRRNYWAKWAQILHETP